MSSGSVMVDRRRWGHDDSTGWAGPTAGSGGGVMTAGWCVRVSVFDELVVSISERELCGRDLSEADQDLIRGCAQHLLSFVGQRRESPDACPTCGGTGVVADLAKINRTGDPHIN